MELKSKDVKAKVILDTNILLAPGQFRVDIFTQLEELLDIPYEIYIVDKTIGELDKIRENGKLPDRKASNIALALLKQKDIKIFNTGDDKGLIVDDYIVKLSDKNTFVVTSDKKLIRRLRSKNIMIIELAQKKYLRIS